MPCLAAQEGPALQVPAAAPSQKQHEFAVCAVVSLLLFNIFNFLKN